MNGFQLAGDVLLGASAGVIIGATLMGVSNKIKLSDGPPLLVTSGQMILLTLGFVFIGISGLL